MMYIDLDNGSYGDENNIYYLNDHDWNDDEYDAFGDLSDSERIEFVMDIEILKEILYVKDISCFNIET